MKFNKLTLTALLFLTPALIQADVSIEQIAQLKDKAIPALKEFAQEIKQEIQNGTIKNKDLAQLLTVVKKYAADGDKPLVPQEAIVFIKNNFGPARDALKSLFNQIPANAFGALENIQAGLGNKVRDLKAQSEALLDKVNIAAIMDQIAQLKVKDAVKFAQDLKTRFEAAGITQTQELNDFIAQAESLEGTLGSLETAANNLANNDFLPNLKELVANKLPAFIKGDAAKREELSDDVLGLVNDVLAQADTAKPFINATAETGAKAFKFVQSFLQNFGPALFNQLTSAERAKAIQAYNALKDNQAQIENVILSVKNKLSDVLAQ